MLDADQIRRNEALRRGDGVGGATARSATADVSGGSGSAGAVKPVVGDFIGYASTYVGAALISGAMVHYPLDPPRFMMIAVAGAALFVVATAFTEFVINRQRATTRAVMTMVPASLALSFGIGSLSGGIQHFKDVPVRAAVLIPVGLALAFMGLAPGSWTRGYAAAVSVTGAAEVRS